MEGKNFECMEPGVYVGPPLSLDMIGQKNVLNAFFPKLQKITFLSQNYEQDSLTTTKDQFKYGCWSESEHACFMKGYRVYGNQWSLIARDFVKSRNRSQVASHAQKFFSKVGK